MGLLPAATQAAPPAVRGISTSESAQGVTRIAIELVGQPTFTTWNLDQPARVVVEIPGARLEVPAAPIDAGTFAVGAIHSSATPGGAARVVVTLRRRADYQVRAEGSAIVLEVTPWERPPLQADAAAAQEAERASAAATQQLKEVREAMAKAEKRAAEAEAEARRLGTISARLAEENAALERRRLEVEAAQQAAAKLASAQQERANSQQQSERKLAAEREAIARAQAEADRTLAKLADEKLALEARKAEIQEARAAAERAAAELRSERQRAEQARQEAEQARQEAARGNARARALLAQAEAAQAQAEAGAKAASREDARRAQAALAEARAETERARANARQAAASVARLEQEWKRLEEARRALAAREEALARNAQQVEAVARQARAADEEMRKAEALIQSLGAERRQLAEERAALEAQRARQAQEQAERQARLDRAVERAEAEKRALAEVAAAAQAKAEAERRAAAESAEAVARAEAEKRALAEAAAAAQAKADSERRAAADAAAARARAEAEKRALAEAVAQAQAQAEAERRALAEAVAQARAQAEAEKRALAEAVAQAQAKAEAEKRALAEAVARAEAQAEAERRAAAERERKLATLQAELARREQALADAASATDTRGRAERQRLEGELARLRQDLAAAQAAARPGTIAVGAPRATEVARAPAPEAPGSRPRSITLRVPSRVQGIDFVDEPARSSVIIDLDEPAQYSVERTGSRVTLRLHHASLPAALERSLDARQFLGPVRVISSYRDPSQRTQVLVEVDLAEAVPNKVRLDGDGTRIYLDFDKPRHGSADVGTSRARTRLAGYGTLHLPMLYAQQPARSERPSANRKRYSGRRIDLDFKGADIHNILRLLADVGSVNIVTSDDVRGEVTIKMRDVPWDQALDVVLRAKGLGQVREGNLIRVAPMQVLEKEMEQEIARKKQAVEVAPTETRLIGVSYAEADEMQTRAKDLLSSRGKISVDSRTNNLIVSDVADNLGLVEELVRNLDTQTAQVVIEARIVEARSTFSRQFGIQWGGTGFMDAEHGNPTGLVFPNAIGIGGGASATQTPSGGLVPRPRTGIAGAVAEDPNFAINLPVAAGTGVGGAFGLTLGSVAGAFNLNLRLTAAETTGQIRILSSPRISTMDNVQASIEQGVAIPISVVSAAGVQTVFVDAKLNLSVKPHVTNEGTVVMDIQVTRNEPDFANTGARGDPTILKKEAKTKMLVRDGDTAVIGGIYQRNSGISYAKFPVLAEIPILGVFFRNRRENDDRTEFLVFITPRIVNRPRALAR